MTDSTEDMRVCELPGCDKLFSMRKNQKYCSYKHQLKNQTINQKNKNGKVKGDLNKFRWHKTKFNQLMKFYQMFGENFSCDICSMSFTDSVETYGVPLFLKLQGGIDDYRTLDPDNWNRFCLKCWENINDLKIEDDSEDG
jgi:hypothetical protein